jgi:hypothetical protein
MFDFVFDNGIIFIAIAIFIGRLILQLRRKGGEERKKPPSPAPVFFGGEKADDTAEEDTGGRIVYSRTRGSSDFLRELVMREAAMEAAAPRRPPVVVQPSIAVKPPVPVQPPVEQTIRRHDEESRPSRGKAGRFPVFLNRLSPLKQAVVLAEILGPPRGI